MTDDARIARLEAKRKRQAVNAARHMAEQEERARKVRELRDAERLTRAAGHSRMRSAVYGREALTRAHKAVACSCCRTVTQPGACPPPVAARMAHHGLCLACLSWADVRAAHAKEAKDEEPWLVRKGRAWFKGALVGRLPASVPVLEGPELPPDPPADGCDDQEDDG